MECFSTLICKCEKMDFSLKTCILFIWGTDLFEVHPRNQNESFNEWKKTSLKFSVMVLKIFNSLNTLNAW